MKTLKKIFTLYFFVLALLFAGNGVVAQDPPPPPPGEHGSTDNQPPGGGVPVGSGIALLLALGAAYGGKKIYDMRRLNK